jgi:hypothetical protein
VEPSKDMTPEVQQVPLPQVPWWKNPLFIGPIIVAIIALIGVIGAALINRPTPPSPNKETPSSVTGNATSSGPNSPANTGSGNTFINGDSSKKGK